MPTIAKERFSIQGVFLPSTRSLNQIPRNSDRTLFLPHLTPEGARLSKSTIVAVAAESGGKTSMIGEAHPGLRQSIYLIPVLE